MWLRVHISLLKELVTTQATRYHEWHAHVRKWSLHEWHQLEAELTRERGIWGPEQVQQSFFSKKNKKFRLQNWINIS